MGMPETAERKRERTEGEKEVVKDDEGRGISVSVARLHTQAATCWKASACSLLLDRSRGIPSRDSKDKQVSCAFL